VQQHRRAELPVEQNLPDLRLHCGDRLDADLHRKQGSTHGLRFDVLSGIGNYVLQRRGVRDLDWTGHDAAHTGMSLIRAGRS